MDIIVGTAGHIDHGKTQLVKALTGTDTDRLPEEKSRGITIDLGFAELAVDDIHFGFVDVPGHERFVKNMLAGASGIDLVLLVVAADEGIMPQTREHFDICRLLEIGRGVIAMTKSDLADSDLIDLVRLEIDELVKGSFLENAPVVAVSSKTGAGLDALKAEMVSAARRVRQRPDDLIARLAIDRSFAVKGFGTVVTGTLASGTLAEGDELDLLPAGRTVRVRGVQSHGAKVQQSVAGRRTAVNLAGTDYTDVTRGMLLAEKGVLHPSQAFDATVEVLANAPKALKTRQRVRLHIGTAEVLARLAVLSESSEIQPGESGFVQLRLETPIAEILGARFILRSYSPQITIAGGSVLRPSREKVRRRNREIYSKFLHKLAVSMVEDTAIARALIQDSEVLGLSAVEIRAVTGWTEKKLTDAVKGCVDGGIIVFANGIYIAPSSFKWLELRVLEVVSRRLAKDHLSQDVSLEAIRTEVFRSIRPEIERAVIESLRASGKISIKGETVELAGHNSQLSDAESDALAIMVEKFIGAGLEVPKPDDVVNETAAKLGLQKKVVDTLFQQLVRSGKLIRISPDIFLSARALTDLIDRVREFAGRSPDRTIDVPAFKELAGVSRKYAIPLLEYFDQTKITARRGDTRIVI